MAEQENKDFSEDVAEQNFEQNGEAENGDQENAGAGGGDATENGQESQEDRYIMISLFLLPFSHSSLACSSF